MQEAKSHTGLSTSKEGEQQSEKNKKIAPVYFKLVQEIFLIKSI
jgi:hypothetical protein